MGWTKLKGWEKWEPEVGDVLEGVFTGVKRMEGAHGPYDSAGVRTGDGGQFFSSSKWLVPKLVQAALRPGDRVRITLAERLPGEGGFGHARPEFEIELWREE